MAPTPSKTPSTISFRDSTIIYKYPYTGSVQGPTPQVDITGSSKAVTYKYFGFGQTNYLASSTKPKAIGTYSVVAYVVADSNYQAANTPLLSFEIKSGISIIEINRSVTAYTYDTKPHGPIISTRKGSLAAITYEYKSLSAASYESATKPSALGSYEVTATLPSDENYDSASATLAFTIKYNPTIAIIGKKEYKYTGNSQGPQECKTDSLGDVTYKYYGTGTTNYASKQIPTGTVPTDLGDYNVIAYLAADNYYNASISRPMSFKIIKGMSSISAGNITYTYTGSPQGIDSNTKTGSNGFVTYKYSSTRYPETAQKPTVVGTYKVVVSVDADTKYNAAISYPLEFAIVKGSSTIAVNGDVYYFSGEGPVACDRTGSTGHVTYMYSGIDHTYFSDAMPTAQGSYQVAVTLLSDDNCEAASSLPFYFTVVDSPNATPDPTPNAANVLSLWGNTYTNVPDINWHPDWSQQTRYTECTVGGKRTIKYSSLNYQGVQFSSNLDLTSMNSIHLDIWSYNVTSLIITLIQTATDKKDYTIALSRDMWNSIDIPLSYFVDVVDLSAITQMSFTADDPIDNGIIYLQNIYFAHVANISATIRDFNIPLKYLGDDPFTITAPTSNSLGAFTYRSSIPSVATVSGNIVTIVGVGSCTLVVTQAAAGAFIETNSTATVLVTGPTNVATSPTRLGENVLSLWGNTYTNVPDINWHPDWGQQTRLTECTVGDAPTIKYSSLNYEGVQFANDLDLTSMNSIHFDVWSPNVTSLRIALISLVPPIEQFRDKGLSLNSWNQVSISLPNFGTLDMAKIKQMKFTALAPIDNGIIYLQNIYFSKPAGSATITGFNVPSKSLGDASFTITAPASNSSGAFSYSSSNTAVATVSGNIVTIVGVGDCNIKAAQAAAGAFVASICTAFFTVTNYGPTIAAPDPTRLNTDVLSLWGNTYTNVPGINWYPGWGQQTRYISYEIDGKSTINYSSLNYEGVELLNDLDISTMTYIHLDIWSSNLTLLSLTLISTQPPLTELPKGIDLTPNTWNSIWIPLDYFGPPNLNRAILKQIKFIALNPISDAVMLLQNIYFSKTKPANETST